MQKVQTAVLLEEIARNTAPEYQKNVPPVFIIGSIGAGKSSLLHGIHRELRYSNAGIGIESKRAHSARQLLKQRMGGVHRANATTEPERLQVYTYNQTGFVPIDFIAEGSHESAKKLIYGEDSIDYVNIPNAAVFCLDLSFLDYLFQPGRKLASEETLEIHNDDTFMIDEHKERLFKSEINLAVYFSLLHAKEHIVWWKKQGVPIIPVATHYRELPSDSQVTKLLAEGKLLTALDEFIARRLEGPFYDKVKAGTATREEERTYYQESPCQSYERGLNNGVSFSQLLTNPIIPIDSRPKPPERKEVPKADPSKKERVYHFKHLYGIEEAAYQIAIAATRGKHPELRLVSFSQQVPDTERVVKYISIPKV
ncbi:MAG: hypothetical protein V2A62_02145 [Candidatus Woesearchaeota archaeon]